jgi:hypothetical protein
MHRMQRPALRNFLASDAAILVYLSFANLLIHFFTNGGYGYFRDEFYYLACGEHLDWGYVDHPPLVALMAYVTRRLLGDSLFALRFFPAVCGALVVFMTGWMTRELGGGRYAQVLAGVAVLVGPVYLAINNYFSMNCFDHLFWVIAVYILILILKSSRPELWPLFGLVAGVGLMTKYSMGFLGFGLVIGLALTPARRNFKSGWLWLGGAIALLIFLPHILWELHHGFPTLEFIRNATLHKNRPFTPPAFLAINAVYLLPLTLPLWVAGLGYYFFSKSGRPYRSLGWIYVSVLALFLVGRAKPYYLAPAYFMLFAGGAIVIEAFLARPRLKWLKTAYVVILLSGGAIAAPFTLPMLPVETYLKYQDFFHFQPPKEERGKQDRLPQQYADMFGWEEMVETVARVYNSLSPDERAKCVIGASNYGEAGAIDFFGRKYSLPKAISSENNYWIWGPGNKPGEIGLMIGGNREEYKAIYEQVEVVARLHNKYARSHEANLPIYLCRRPKMTLQQIWPRIKNFG